MVARANVHRDFPIKIIRKVITMTVFIAFAIFFLKEKLAWNSWSRSRSLAIADVLRVSTVSNRRRRGSLNAANARTIDSTTRMSYS